ncbi:MAG TPA: ATP-binding protein [Patescibacteria group bacterium]|nr:ATP-binding protein [Patescibacteria group bacterium]
MEKINNYISTPGRGYAVKANYSNQIVEDYIDNPLIEALPPIFLRNQVEELLHMYPKYNEKECELDAPYRYHCIQRLFKYFQPLSKHFDIEQRVSRIIRQGYISRNPLMPEHASDMQKIYQMIKENDYSFDNSILSRTTASGFTIIGISGMGKTTSIDRVLSLYPQIVVHSEYNGQPLNQYQLVWLKLDCPYDGSVKGLCTSFFLEFDRLFGDNTYKKFAGGRNISVNTMMPRMAQLARNFNLGVLVIDEIQHLSLAKSGGSEKMLNFFVNLVNTIGVPVILIGTTHALSVLQSEFRQARRGSGQGDLVWERMKNDIQWELLIRGLWRYQWTKEYTPLTNELKDALYEESQGIVDIAIKLFAMAQMKAIATGKEIITPGLIKHVAKESLRLVKPMLDALKSNDIKQIAKYDDIKPIDIQGFYEEYYNQLNEKEIRKKSQAQSKQATEKFSIMESAVLKLIDLGIEAETAKTSVEKAMDNADNHDLNAIAREAVKIALQIEKSEGSQSRKSSSKRRIEYAESDLRLLQKEANKINISMYDMLKSKGYIKNPVEEFIMAR